ncbi:unnamed protein product [Closterium sp. NIES-54]
MVVEAGGATGAVGTGGAGGTAGARGAGAAGARGAAGAGGATGAAGAGGAGAAGARGAGAADQSQLQLLPGSPLPDPAPHIERVVLPEPPVSSLPHVPHLESDLAHAASPTVTRLLATVVTGPDFESTAAFSLVTELVDFAARSRLDYVASLVNESQSVFPKYVGGESALSSDVLEDRKFELECLATALPCFASMLLCPEGDPDAFDIPTPHSYAEAIAAHRDYELHSLDFSTAFLQGSLHEEIWLRHPPGFTGSFPAGTQWSLRRLVYGLRQVPREWHDTLRTTLAALGFTPSTADPSLFLRTDTTLPPFYVLVYVDDLVLATADTEALAEVKAQLQERYTCTDLGPLALRLPVLLATAHSSVYRPLALSFTFGRVHRAEWSIPRACRLPHVHWDAAKRILRYLCSTSSIGLVLGGRGSVVLTGHSDTSWADDQATQRSSQGYTFSLGSGSVAWRSTRSSSVLSSNYEAEIYAGAMGAQELRWLTYLLTYLGERPRSLPVLYVDNMAMLALCHEQRLEHRTKHIALRYFLARELQQHRQLRLSYVASRANTADAFTKALVSGDHQRFCTALELVPTLPHLLVA